MGLDQVGFQNEGFDFGVGDDLIHCPDTSDERPKLGAAIIPARPEIGIRSASQRFGFAYVNDDAFPITHDVDAVFIGQMLQHFKQLLPGLFGTHIRVDRLDFQNFHSDSCFVCVDV